MSSRQVLPHADLNVTPLIDVLLVLLVIFMATLPLAQKSLDTSVPQETKSVGGPLGTEQIVVQADATGALSINQQPVASADLQGRLTEIFESRHDKTVYILGAGTLRYGSIVAIIDAAKGAGVSRVGVITEGMRRAAGVS